MKRAMVLGLVVALVGCVMAQSVEIGVRYYVGHNPYAEDEGYPLHSVIGIYGLLRTASGWAVRLAADTPFAAWAPAVSLRSRIALSPRWSFDADLSLAKGLDDFFRVILALGGSAIVTPISRTQIAFGSLPLMLGASQYRGDWSFRVLPAFNLYADIAWIAAPKLVVGETIGVELFPAEQSDIPLSENLGLIFHSFTRVGLNL